MTTRESQGLGWLQIVRLGFVQAALGSIVVLTTSTLNRVMVVELSLAAVIPGLLVGLHYAVQISRPLWGHGSDAGGNRTAWIVGGIALLALAGTGAAASTAMMQTDFPLGVALAALSYALIGFGIGASGTSLLALLASRTAPHRRPAAATIVWMMMIAGIVATAIISGILLDPFSMERMIAVTAGAGAIAFCVTLIAVWGIERRSAIGDARPTAVQGSFRESLAETLADPHARLFTIFVFVSMLAYSMQDLILEPYGGLLFAMTPGETTKLAGFQHAGVLGGMAMVGILGSMLARAKPAILRFFTVSGCAGSAAAMALLSVSAVEAPHWPLAANIILLGFFNGAFAVAAIGSMMMLAGAGPKSREGIRMGVWGAAQAIAFGLGGFMGTVLIDLARFSTGNDGLSFALVFALEAALFLAAAMIALAVQAPPQTRAVREAEAQADVRTAAGMPAE
jgi:BCD family chlorophyll transporter-like MFS transporter